MAETSGAMAAKSVLDLLAERQKKLEGKKTVFGTYLDFVTKEFLLDHPGQEFKDYYVPIVEERWQELSNAKKNVFRELNRQQNQVIDLECKEIDQAIILARPGPRVYTGAPIRIDVAEVDKDDKNAMTFDPIFWFVMSVHIKKAKSDPHYQWRDNVEQLVEDGAENWSSLPKKEQDKFIKRAKNEWRAFHGKAVGDAGDEIVDAILAEKLAAHKFKKELRHADETWVPVD